MYALLEYLNGEGFLFYSITALQWPALKVVAFILQTFSFIWAHQELNKFWL